MPSATVKRAQTQSQTLSQTAPAMPATKKQRVDPNCRGVIEALEQSELPQHVRAMLIACVPKAFQTQPKERHASQEKIIDMIDSAVTGVLNKLNVDAKAAGEAVSACEAERAELTERITSAADDATKLREIHAEIQIQSKEAADAFDVAEAAIAHAKQIQQEQAGLKDMMESVLPPLVEGVAPPEDMAVLFEKLQPFMNTVQLEESLSHALPSTFMKKAAERGNFDSMVVAQTRRIFEEKLRELTSQVESAEAAFREADVALDHKTSTQSKLVEAEEAVVKSEKALSEAKESLTAFNETHKDVFLIRDTKNADVENFKLYNVGCFDVLRGSVDVDDDAATATSAPTAVAGGA